MTKATSGLEKVHNLYTVQIAIVDMISGGSTDIDAVKKYLREFKKLLKEVDPAFMGGEDVWESLLKFPGEVDQKLQKKGARRKTTPVAKRAAKKTTAKKAAQKKKAVKKVAKKKK